jgi:acyl-[acyl carrier protein]--UDP-N-acetylglucosamine O-acyltransferase
MTAYVHPSAIVGENFKPAPFTIIDSEVTVGDNVITGSFVHIRYAAHIAGNVRLGITSRFTTAR